MLSRPPIRIAMWSGPRNISTEMMRAWGNRADTIVVDEPFYAQYLHATGLPHPGAIEVIADGEIDPSRVAEYLTTAPLPAGKLMQYQKQMTHHLLPGTDRSWLSCVQNCFLIRDPADVIVSYLKKNGEPTAEDLGFPQQLEIFERVRALTGKVPPVIEADAVLRDPPRMLRLLCDSLGVEFSDAMLSWPAGLRESDGIWAKHWYSEVAKSTGFQQRAALPAPSIPSKLREVHARCREIYEQLHAHRLR